MSELIELFENLKITNKGTCAGGSKTNLNGKSFEKITDIENKLYENAYEKVNMDKSKYGYYLYKNINNSKIIYVSQNGLKLYIKKYFNIDLFRYPDEAYIIEKDGKYIIKILEKKAQYVEGSVETKLWSGHSLKREYEIVLGENFRVEYAFCLSKFLQDKFNSDSKKYTTLNKILNESNILVFYGQDDDYFEKIYQWINNF